MKKLLLTAALATLTATAAFAGECPNCKDGCPPPPPPCEGKCPPPPPCKMNPHKVELDKKLNLTDEQKAQAKDLRVQTHEKLKPLFMDLKDKQQAKREFVNTEDLSEEQMKEYSALRAEIRELKREIHNIRVQNM